MIKRVVGAAVVISATVLGPAAVITTGSTAAAASTSTTKPAKPPKQWDPRVREFVKFVERDRGLKFDHPFAVEFLDDEAFVEALNEGNEPTKADRRAAEHNAAQLRATGMIGPDVDLIGTWSEIDDTGTTGFYDSETKKLYVRGDDLTDTEVQLTVVHELTHALQDQHFDLGKLDDRVRNSGQGFAEDALIEGDATTVENDYFFSLPQREQDAYNASFDEPTDAGTESAAAPDEAVAAAGAEAPVLEAFDAAPYDYGSQFVTFVIDDRGTKAVDELFRTLPQSEEQIIDPVATHWREKPLTVPTPKLAAGEKAVGAPDVWGAYSLYLMLAARIDPVTALEAVDGWGGDSYRAFTNADGVECVRVAFEGDTRADTREFADAVDEWAAQMPAGGVESATAGGVVTFTACDVGGVTSPDPERIADASDLLYDRNHFAQGMIAEGAPYEIGRCLGAKMAQDQEIVDLEWGDTEPTDEQQAMIEDRVTEYAKECT